MSAFGVSYPETSTTSSKGQVVLRDTPDKEGDDDCSSDSVFAFGFSSPGTSTPSLQVVRPEMSDKTDDEYCTSVFAFGFASPGTSSTSSQSIRCDTQDKKDDEDCSSVFAQTVCSPINPGPGTSAIQRNASDESFPSDRTPINPTYHAQMVTRKHFKRTLEFYDSTGLQKFIELHERSGEIARPTESIKYGEARRPKQSIIISVLKGINMGAKTSFLCTDYYHK